MLKFGFGQTLVYGCPEAPGRGQLREGGSTVSMMLTRKRLRAYPELQSLAVEHFLWLAASSAASLRQLATARDRESPVWFPPAVRPAFLHRWTGMQAVGAQRSLVG